ncbi:ABC transporter permease [Salisediminibacterium halotolerans]|uniref:ABC transporter permease n=1 Tax=Salisediminibacterium halotolerans TaxID=517425 RepID=UPI000EB27EF2|nr:ABC transporter permease [Salisediminibacterium halotolerans]RLJ72268.1 ABC-2 type transport system permease protein [Actinophytocola xinjiangensis]RPE85482.1 ABC-2 type transport system permease protein [Salisediminibacterium halotolerans]TWG33437.1 ABC-2 type transport system permease protein [Salisediminibacterium halotolerans]GEL07049.1 hypothetical protein SHA02_04650 [Salisediminibacterium halotolerans]
MFKTMLGKEVKQLLRERSELLTLLIMPVILITILGSALQNMMSPGSAGTDKVTTAVVSETSQEEELNNFADYIANQEIPEEERETLIEEAVNVSVPELLTETLNALADDGFLVVSEYAGGAAEKDNYDGVWHFEADYREQAWKQMFLGEERPEPAEVEASGQTAVIEGVSDAFFNELNWQKEATYLALAEGEALPEPIQTEVNVEQLDNRSVITSFDYYTAGMAVMFVLYTATFLATTAHTERKSHVYHRLLTSNVPMWMYLAGKGGAGVLLSLLQLSLIFTFSSLVFDVSFQNLGLTAVIAGGLALTVGSLSMLLTAVNYRIRNEQASALFASVGVTILAFLGGSFFNVSQLSETVATIGRILPNGAAMQSLLAVMGGAGSELIYPMLLSIIVFSVLFAGAALLVFPRKEDL